jgi:hypothetical protein
MDSPDCATLEIARIPEPAAITKSNALQGAHTSGIAAVDGAANATCNKACANQSARNSKEVVIGIYVILFGLGMSTRKVARIAKKGTRLTVNPVNGLLEFQIPPQVSRYASFLFSFIGRGICKFWSKFPVAVPHVANTA